MARFDFELNHLGFVQDRFVADCCPLVFVMVLVEV